MSIIYIFKQKIARGGGGVTYMGQTQFSSKLELLDFSILQESLLETILTFTIHFHKLGKKIVAE